MSKATSGKATSAPKLSVGGTLAVTPVLTVVYTSSKSDGYRQFLPSAGTDCKTLQVAKQLEAGQFSVRRVNGVCEKNGPIARLLGK